MNGKTVKLLRKRWSQDRHGLPFRSIKRRYLALPEKKRAELKAELKGVV